MIVVLNIMSIERGEAVKEGKKQKGAGYAGISKDVLLTMRLVTLHELVCYNRRELDEIVNIFGCVSYLDERAKYSDRICSNPFCEGRSREESLRIDLQMSTSGSLS